MEAQNKKKGGKPREVTPELSFRKIHRRKGRT